MTVAFLAACGAAGGTGNQRVGRVTYEVSGGFTGWDRVLTVEADGTARVDVKRGPSPASARYQVDAATMTRLHSLLSDPAFARLEAVYLPPPGGADLQDYTVTAEVGHRTFTTMTRDGANPPAILSDVLSVLNGILATTGVR